MIKKLSNGFTIVETTIVLAMMGLMMGTVFLAVPAVQRNSRDTTRKNIVNRLKTEIETYAANNQGTYPFQNGCATTGCWSDFYTTYINSGSNALVNDKDPGTGQSIIAGTSAYAPKPCAGSCSGPSTAGTADVFYSAKCSGITVVNAGAAPDTGTKSYAIIIALEKSGTYYCADNS